MRAHGHLHGAVRQGGQHGGALPLRRGAGEQRRLHIRSGKKAGERGEVLAGQQLGGRHERRLQAVLRRLPAQGGGHRRFAAAHVALHEAVHGRGARHVRRGLAHGAALRPRGRKGQPFPELLHRVDRRGRRAAAPAAAFQAEQARLKHKQFLIDQPFPRPRQGGRVRREMDVPQRFPERAEAAGFADSGRDRVADLFRQKQQRLPHGRFHGAAVQPLRLAVNRADGRAGARGEAFRRDHLALEEIGLHPAVKHIRFPLAQRVRGVGIVEECDGKHGFTVVRGGAVDRHAALHARAGGRLHHRRAHGAHLAGLRQADRPRMAQILIGARVAPQQVAHRGRADFAEQGGALFPHAAQRRDRRLKQGSHVSPSFPERRDRPQAADPPILVIHTAGAHKTGPLSGAQRPWNRRECEEVRLCYSTEMRK